MDILRRYVISERPTMMKKNGIRLQAIGQVDRLPVLARLPLRALIKETKNNSDMTLTGFVLWVTTREFGSISLIDFSN